MMYIEKFRSETTLIARYTESKAFVVWAMGLYLDIQDLENLADDNLTDNSDDHGIDFLRFDEDEGVLYLAQGYYTKKILPNAPASKAADLNASCAWLIKGEVDKFHPTIRTNIEEARNAILSDKVQKIILAYVHDCGESKEVISELTTAKASLTALLGGKDIEVNAVQIGNESLERLFQNQVANIIVRDRIECPFPVKYYEEAVNWKSAVLTVSAQWLRSCYTQYSGDLFSANYRGFLGNSRQKINTGIKVAAEHNAENFWAFNNGITILTTDIEQREGKTILNGMSIINGAQTTGSIGAIPMSTNLDDVKILTRIIECSNPAIIGDIVKFNNTQNKITAWDSFSNDSIQTKLQEEFRQLGHDYNIKRGFSNRASLLSVDAAIQPLLALSGNYKNANRSKTYIFESLSLYNEAFEHRGARNVLFACCMNTCLQMIKSENKSKVESGTATDTEKILHNIFAVIKYKYYVLSIIAKSLSRLIPSLTEAGRISFMPNQSKATDYNYDALVTLLKPITELILPFMVNSLGDDFYSKYNDVSTVGTIASSIETSITGIKAVMPEVQTKLDAVASVLCNG